MPNEQAPTIRVIGFKTTYEPHPKRGDDPLNDTVDEKGFLLDDKGRRIMETIAVDWVTYAPSAGVLSTQNTDRVMSLMPDQNRIGNDQDGSKYQFMAARWAQIEPAYAAWKNGQALPTNGTGLTAWPGVNAGQIEVLRHYGIMTIEEVRDLTDAQCDRVKLPNMLDLKKQAKLFLDNTGAAAAAAREADKDNVIQAMQDRLAEMEALLKAKPVAAGGDDVDALRAELDARGIEYDRRWAAPKLRALLAPADETEAA